MAPRVRPVVAEWFDASVGRELWVSAPVLPEATDDAFDLALLKVDCIRSEERRVGKECPG